MNEPIIDGHLHLWTRGGGGYGWITPDLVHLDRDFVFADLAPHLIASGVDHSVLVQADATEADTDAMLAIAASEPRVAAVVGWVDLTSPSAPAHIAKRADHPRFRGVRAMVQDDTDPRWLLSESASQALMALQRSGLTLDALIRWHQIELIQTVADEHPGLTLVLDHAGKPPLGTDNMDPWAQMIGRIAKRSNVVCKLSGLTSDAVGETSAWELDAVLDVLGEAFGPDRLLWGSDWPVTISASGYAEAVRTMKTRVAGRLGKGAVAAVFSLVAKQTYGLHV